MKYEIIQINYIKEKAKARLSCSVYILKLTFLSEGLSNPNGQAEAKDNNQTCTVNPKRRKQSPGEKDSACCTFMKKTLWYMSPWLCVHLPDFQPELLPSGQR